MIQSRRLSWETRPCPALKNRWIVALDKTIFQIGRESQKLYVVNHAYAKGGERIDVFKLALGKKDGKVGAVFFACLDVCVYVL